MKSNKLTPLDELHLEKKRLREERAISGQRLSYQLQYLADNWGSMLTKGVTGSLKNKLAETMENLHTVPTLRSTLQDKRRKRFEPGTRQPALITGIA